jgi:hypothetical protein
VAAHFDYFRHNLVVQSLAMAVAVAYLDGHLS